MSLDYGAFAGIIELSSSVDYSFDSARQLQAVSDSNDFNLFADDLQALLSGEVSELEFRAKYERQPVLAVVRAIWPNLEHYLSDRDIRARDPGYRSMQDAELAKLIRLVRIGAPDSELTTITFLRVS